MTDYYPLLRKAIERLDRPSEGARYNVYERGRQALVRQLRGAGIVDEKLDRHLEALDHAVAQIESEFASGRKEPTRVLRAVVEEPSPAQDRTALAPAPDLAEPRPRATPTGHSASVLRQWALAMVGALLAVVLAATVSFYYFK